MDLSHASGDLFIRDHALSFFEQEVEADQQRVAQWEAYVDPREEAVLIHKDEAKLERSRLEPLDAQLETTRLRINERSLDLEHHSTKLDECLHHCYAKVNVEKERMQKANKETLTRLRQSLRDEWQEKAQTQEAHFTEKSRKLETSLC